jgi:hypothetical protein
MPHPKKSEQSDKSARPDTDSLNQQKPFRTVRIALFMNDSVCELCAGLVRWAREVSFQTVHSVSCCFSLSNNLGNLLFARRTTPMVSSDGLLIRF